jgi:hypothetical protein
MFPTGRRWGSAACRAGPSCDAGRRPELERRGWDSNPRSPKGSSVFKTDPFDRSGTPPRGDPLLQPTTRVTLSRGALAHARRAAGGTPLRVRAGEPERCACVPAEPHAPPSSPSSPPSSSSWSSTSILVNTAVMSATLNSRPSISLRELSSSSTLSASRQFADSARGYFGRLSCRRVRRRACAARRTPTAARERRCRRLRPGSSPSARSSSVP